jgi:hypothetical protein
MIRIAITTEAFPAIEATLPIGTVAFEPERTASGGRFLTSGPSKGSQPYAAPARATAT